MRHIKNAKGTKQEQKKNNNINISGAKKKSGKNCSEFLLKFISTQFVKFIYLFA